MGWIRIGAAWVATLALALGLPALASGHVKRASGHVTLPCTGDPNQIHTFSVAIPKGQTTTGLHDSSASVDTGIYALPSTRPRGLVLFAHGHNNTPEAAWETHLRQTAKQDDAIAVAMDYYDPQPPTPLPSGVGPDDYGWRVAEGADFSVAAARAFDAACHPRTTVMYGVSMGGETAGLAVAEKARRPGGRPLFDYLFDIEGVANVLETYAEAAATSNYAQGEIEEETGGTPQQVPSAYAARDLVDRVSDVAVSGVRGVVVVQAADDGLVPYDQNREFISQLAADGVPVDYFTVGTRGKLDTANPNPLNLTGQGSCSADPGDCQTTLDGYVDGEVPGFTSPFAGHGWEGSNTQPVIVTGFERLGALLNLGVVPSGYHEYLADPNLGVVPIAGASTAH
ncbi:MAG: alpha/beta hydrolase family protein [Solirubrobacteraceae bacterium]